VAGGRWIRWGRGPPEFVQASPRVPATLSGTLGSQRGGIGGTSVRRVISGASDDSGIRMSLPEGRCSAWVAELGDAGGLGRVRRIVAEDVETGDPFG
jgi:hypothetical protein